MVRYSGLSDLQGSIIPKYLGFFTLKSRFGRHSRIVHLILIERIHGLSMDRIDSYALPREERQEIVKHIIDAKSSFYSRNVIHDDFYPRNVFVKHEGD